jgi:uncharacterized protein (TIGR02996 family)
VISESEFQAALDAHPDDHVTRLVFADWLEGEGDPRAEGYRALGLLRRSPHLFRDHNNRLLPRIWSGRSKANCWLIYYRQDAYNIHLGRIPADWHDAVTGGRRLYFPGNGLEWPKEVIAPRGWHPVDREFTSDRRAVDELTVWGFLKLPAERRAELLAAEEART